ncbi:MAG TPA: flagellar protein FliS [Candidatus Sulfotelmatobacter sp.]|jgi:flagellar protein FliS|nr:flagellar protein FliS [Candidatus Sulfotelmatobacter sp.]
MDAKHSYRETAVRGAGPVRLVILLYEQAIADLGKALAAQQIGAIEERTREINHAILVLGHLEASLDNERGGQVAYNLERFYQQVRAGLIDAQCRQSADAIQRQISLLMTVHEAWCEVDRTTAAPVDTPGAPLQALSSEHRATTKWKA